jgi:hypothetical protein
VEQLSALSDAKVAAIVRESGEIDRRNARHAMVALLCGTGGFIVCLCLFTYLIRIGEPKAAYIVIGSGVLTFLWRIAKSRLHG